MTPKYPNIKVKLTDNDGNAFMILGLCLREAKTAGLEKHEMRAFRDEAMKGDYDHLILTAARWFECE